MTLKKQEGFWIGSLGYKISPILWDKVQRGISAGRVQSVALRIISDREIEVKKFVPEQWFTIAWESTKDGKAFEVRYHGEEKTKKKRLKMKSKLSRFYLIVKEKTLASSMFKRESESKILRLHLPLQNSSKKRLISLALLLKEL